MKVRKVTTSGYLKGKGSGDGWVNASIRPEDGALLDQLCAKLVRSRAAMVAFLIREAAVKEGIKTGL